MHVLTKMVHNAYVGFAHSLLWQAGLTWLSDTLLYLAFACELKLYWLSDLHWCHIPYCLVVGDVNFIPLHMQQFHIFLVASYYTSMVDLEGSGIQGINKARSRFAYKEIFQCDTCTHQSAHISWEQIRQQSKAQISEPLNGWGALLYFT